MISLRLSVLTLCLLIFFFCYDGAAVSNNLLLDTTEIEEIKKEITEAEGRIGLNDKYVISIKDFLANHHLYHRPQTEVENILEDIMYSGIGRCIFFKDFPGKKECEWRGELLVTDHFITSIRKSAAEHCKSSNDLDADEYCLGPWGEGYDAIECADGMTEEGYDWTPYYYTVSQSENEAVIMMLFRKPLYPGKKRRMVKESGKWKLDAVDCGRGWNKLPFGME